jgi:hypothetical protein
VCMLGQSRVWLLVSLLACFGAVSAAAEVCPTAKDEIATDRPDVTNSSLVVPAGSLQSENGVNASARDGARIFDGTNSRLRLGVAPCLEVLVDAPNYFAVFSGEGDSGATDLVPAIKWQISPIPGKVDLSIVVGTGLPIGTRSVAGRGVEPYVQFPWCWAAAGGSTASSRASFFSSEPEKLVIERTLSLEKQVGKQAESSSSTWAIMLSMVCRATC